MTVTASFWKLKKPVNGYAHETGNELVTQAAAGRCFQILDSVPLARSVSYKNRIKVRFLEDGYYCWLDSAEFDGWIVESESFKPLLLTHNEIKMRIPKVLAWIEKASLRPNEYLWGGTLGPNFDCSGLVQTAFAQNGIWLPRDAYQQEEFCKPLYLTVQNLSNLLAGDLIFFGDSLRCSHVAIFCGKGFYWHSSGRNQGRNGIGCDCLSLSDTNPIACHYRSQLRGAGRIVACYDGLSLP